MQFSRALLALLFVTALTTPTIAADRAVILHWNDFHGQVQPYKQSSGERGGGIRALSAYVEEARQEFGDEMLLVDAGDWFQGTPEGNLTSGKLVFDLYNAVGVDVTVVGNHDFDFGETVLQDLVKRARFPVLGANLLDEAGVVRDFVQPTWVRKVGGITFGFIGLLTPDTPRIVRQDVGRKLRVGNPVDACRELIPGLRAQGAEVFVVLSHLGIDLERHLAQAVPELHLIIGGHSHTPLNKPEVMANGVVCAQAGAKGLFVGRLEVTRKDGGGFAIDGGLVPIIARDEPVAAAIEQILAEYTPAIEAQMSRKVGVLAKPLDPAAREAGPGSTPLGNWLADVIAHAADAPIAVHNRGGIRASLAAGDITVRDLFQLSPFGNRVVSCEMTGAALTEVIQTSLTDPRVRLEVSGLEVEWREGAEGPELVQLTAGGTPILPDQVYKVATNDYLANGGDGWTQFKARGDPVGAGVGVMEATVRAFEAGSVLAPDEMRFELLTAGVPTVELSFLQRYIGVVGLLVMLAVCWFFSKHRSAINGWTVLWGLGLQTLLAIIILAGNQASFTGMAILIALILTYLVDTTFDLKEPGSRIGGALGAIGAGAVVVVGLYSLERAGVTPWFMGLTCCAFLFAAATKQQRPLRLCFALLVTGGFARLLAHQVPGRDCFRFLSDKVEGFLQLTNAGSTFLFGNLANSELFFPGSDTWPGFGFQFAFSVLPTIIFFSAFMSVMYYLGIVQFVIGAISKFMRWSMRTSGSETLSCSANIFVGQTEAPFMVKPFLPRMTQSEIHAVMVGGFATVAGGVLAAYIGMGVNPGHLLAASVMSAPAAIMIAKVLFPETEHSETAGDVEVPKIETADNVVSAASNGVTDGLKLALNVGAMLVGFIALVAFVDVVLGAVDAKVDGQWLAGTWLASGELMPNGEFAGRVPGSLKTLFGTIFQPLAYLMGVSSWEEAREVGALMGTKLSVNEFVAYLQLQGHIQEGDISERSIVIATYALCGFANFSSIGIQIGGIGVLAPERRGELASLAVRAMWGGAIASWMTATVAGILYTS
ncbi:MAG: nucleoside transporter C-terminal domain-containing protein [Planctomycetota bacterium]